MIHFNHTAIDVVSIPRVAAERLLAAPGVCVKVYLYGLLRASAQPEQIAQELEISKEELFEALVGEPHDYLIGRFKNAQQEFAQLPHEQQPEVMGDISGLCMLRYVPLCLCAFGGM